MTAVRYSRDEVRIQVVRIALSVLALTAILLPSLYQPFLDTVYRLLLSTSLYRSSVFETVWTVFLYAAVEVSLTVAFMRHPEWRFAQQDSKKIWRTRGT